MLKKLNLAPAVKIGTSLGVLILSVGGIVHLWHVGFGAGWRLFVFGVFCCIATVAIVLWLSWSWIRIFRSVTSLVDQLNQKSGFVHTQGPALVDRLAEALGMCIKGYTEQNHSLKEQNSQLQIQIQLANRQKQNAEAIIYSIRDAVIVVDASADRLLMANESAGKLFDFDHKNCLFKPISELVPDDKKEFVEFLSHSRGTKSSATRKELEFVNKVKLRIFDCIVSCVYDQREQICGVVAVLHDITREKEVSQMKNDFVSHVSHELKTPLASIMAYSEMLTDGEANDEETRKEFYSVIQNQANRLSRLIEDILNTARIESGLIKVDKKPVSMTILIEEQLEMIKGFAQEKDIEVIGQKPIVFDQVYVDKDMISQVIVNLLSNAVKYTKQGGTVRVDTEVDDAAQIVRVKVTDTGVGIPEEDIEHIFDKFYRVGANKKQAKGTGLGLNLVKQIVEKVHGGKVFVTSKVNQGSTFGFELPLAAIAVAATNG
ncbi:MAG: ATP-binding protein [Phycisphaerales bacterium]|jgi:two-component system phosphate regulon sensor histidine kinase PhoR